jgi:hypothetical protein
VLATSAVVTPAAHIAIYGASAFVPPSNGFGGLPVGCFTGHPCSITTTITSGSTVLARSGREPLASGGGGILYFRLSPAARGALARARGHRLPVQATIQDSSGARTSTALNLVPFATSGAGPHRSLSPSSTLQLVGTTDFVNSGGVGGVLARCQAAVSPCSAAATVSVGRTVIARTGREFLGAGDLGYVIFSLTPSGRSLLAHAPGNQLGAQVSISGGGATASGQIALVGFS